MVITKKTWVLFITSALVSVACWFYWSHSEFAFVNLSVNKSQAFDIAKNFLQEERSVDRGSFQQATILSAATAADRYLQKTLGFKKTLKFFVDHDLDMFFWDIRFFQEGEKEEFRVRVSSATGEIIHFRHIIDDAAYREETTSQKAENLAKKFLSEKFLLDFHQYTFHEKNIRQYDNRVDYSFAWRKTKIDIPWSEDDDSGTAKLLTGVTISGDDVRSFSKSYLSIPDQFSRFIAQQKQTGDFLSSLFLFLYYGLIVIAIFFMVMQHSHLIMQRTKYFYLWIAGLLFTLSLLHIINHLPYLLHQYPTTSSLGIYFFQIGVSVFIGSLFLYAVFVALALSGESLHRKNFPHHPQGGFLHYLLSSFFSKSVGSLIIMGYLTAIIMLGIQAIALELGRQYCGVWVERLQLPQVSTAYFPFLIALTIGIRASLTEEITFRLFGMNWAKIFFKNTLFAAFLMSVIWGFGHTHYPIFPSWFRGLEVSILGFFLSYVFLKYGIIPVVIAHYLFDVFWGSAAFLFGQARAFDTYTCLLILLFPLFFAIIAFIRNETDQEKTLTCFLGKNQRYNLKILLSFLKSSESQNEKSMDEIEKDLLRHGWDAILVQEAITQHKQINQNVK